MKTRKMVTLGLLTAIALPIFMIESQIPPLTPVPGIKLGLANIVTVFTVYAIGSREGLLVLCARVFLGAVFAGNFSTILYSGAGGLAAILVTIGLKKILREDQLFIAGILGAVAHSLGQMGMAILIAGTPSLALYLPVMLLCSMVTGCFTGFCAQFVLKRGKKLWKTISR